MMKLIQTVKRILSVENYVLKAKKEDEYRNQRGIALIAAVAFLVMSVLNIKEESYIMLGTTAISFVFLIIGYLVSKYGHNSTFLRVIFYIIFIVIFTNYTILGGNEGFAALWLVPATYAVMIAIDFKAGFLIGLYYLVMLILTFVGPFPMILQYDYNKTFLLRFPFFYATNFAFATYIIIRIRGYQYDLLLKRQELEQLSNNDLSTGLRNRNSYEQFEQNFQCDNLMTLSAVFIDVNGLHEINNRNGHDAGDKMLCFVADLCKKYFLNDTIFRMGGDEFLILCPNAEEEKVYSIMDKLYDEIIQEGYSISYGIAKQAANFNLDELVKEADALMVEFKREYYQHTDRCKR